MIERSIIYLSGVFISSIAQVILKKAAKKEYKTIVLEYMNIYVFLGYCLFFCSTLLTIYALKTIDLSLGGALEAAGYIFVALLSRIFLGESSTKLQKMGYILIIVGVLIFSLF